MNAWNHLALPRTTADLVLYLSQETDGEPASRCRDSKGKRNWRSAVVRGSSRQAATPRCAGGGAA